MPNFSPDLTGSTHTTQTKPKSLLAHVYLPNSAQQSTDVSVNSEAFHGAAWRQRGPKRVALTDLWPNCWRLSLDSRCQSERQIHTGFQSAEKKGCSYLIFPSHSQKDDPRRKWSSPNRMFFITGEGNNILSLIQVASLYPGISGFNSGLWRVCNTSTWKTAEYFIYSWMPFLSNITVNTFLDYHIGKTYRLKSYIKSSLH